MVFKSLWQLRETSTKGYYIEEFALLTSQALIMLGKEPLGHFLSGLQEEFQMDTLS